MHVLFLSLPLAVLLVFPQDPAQKTPPLVRLPFLLPKQPVSGSPGHFHPHCLVIIRDDSWTKQAGSWVGNQLEEGRATMQVCYTWLRDDYSQQSWATTTQCAYYKISFIDKIAQTFKKTSACHNKGAIGNKIRGALGHRDQSADVTSQPLPQAHPAQPQGNALASH